MTAAYAPFGEAYAESFETTTNRNFTGQTQDVAPGATGNYDFLFRQYSSSQGRWLVPDPAGLAAVDLTNPQTWNRYAYVGNNPLSNVDPDGLCPKGMHEADSTEAQQVVDTAMTYVDQNIDHTPDGAKYNYEMVGGQLKQIDCSGLVCQAMNGNPFADPYIWNNHNVYGTSQIPSHYDKADGPAVGNLILFRGHVGIVTNTDPLSFVGSQSSTGPAVVDTSTSTYWSSRVTGNTKKKIPPASYYKPCVPDKAQNGKGAGGNGPGGFPFNFYIGNILGAIAAAPNGDIGPGSGWGIGGEIPPLRPR